MAGRAVYGRIYEVVLRGQPVGQHSYVGKTTQTIHRRVHGPNGHTCAADVAKDPWKASILPGRAGYRQLEVVYDQGDDEENHRALARAEAFWIDRLRPAHNDVRPVRPIGEVPHRTRRIARSRPRSIQARRRRRRSLGKPVGLLLMVALFTFLAARAILAMQLPWPQAPWVGAPAAGLALGWTAFWKLHRSARRLMR